MAKIAGIILAAGLSSRFPGNKLLAVFQGEVVIRRIVAAALASRLDRVILVVGHQASDVMAAVAGFLESPRLSTALNPLYAKGQSSSIRTGIEALEPDAKAALFMTADQPLLTPLVIDALLQHYAASGKDICYPKVEGVRRNPVVFARRFFPELSALAGDAGGRRIVEAHAEEAASLAFEDPRPFADIDTHEDLLALEKAP
jgi:molybdenum cofactor cytidylyltransferase